MPCKAYAESIEGMEQYMRSATEHDCETAISTLRGLSCGFGGCYSPNCARLNDLANRAEQIAVERFGQCFGVPF